jgi:hypothetical protein
MIGGHFYYSWIELCAEGARVRRRRKVIGSNPIRITKKSLMIEGLFYYSRIELCAEGARVRRWTTSAPLVADMCSVGARSLVRIQSESQSLSSLKGFFYAFLVVSTVPSY